MKPEIFRAHLLRHKAFLKSMQLLSEPKIVKQHLLHAKEQELQTLIRVLHFYTKGQIPINATLFSTLTAAKLIKTLRKTVEKNKDCQKAVRSQRADKLELLQKFSKYLPQLLNPLFLHLDQAKNKTED